MSGNNPIHLSETYIHLQDNGSATTIPVTPDFWPTIVDRKDLHEGRLVTMFSVESDWTTWEMHPEGEEILFLASGEIEFILDQAGVIDSIILKEKETLMIPRGAWHRAVVRKPGKLVGITYGRGTVHRPV